MAFGCKHKDLFGIQLQLELIHEFHGIGLRGFQHFSHFGNPGIQGRVTVLVFVLPVGGESFFGYLVHAATADLDFHPFAFRPHDSRMQGFIAIDLGGGYPVSEPVGVGLVLVRDQGIDLPAIGFFEAWWAVKDDSNRKQIIDFFKVYVLFFHFVEDGRNAFGSSLDFGLQAGLG